MNYKNEVRVATLVGLGVLAVLIWTTVVTQPPLEELISPLLFLALIIFAMSFSIVLADGLASLLPLISIVAYMTLGTAVTGWLIFLGALIHGVIRWYLGDWLLLKRPTSLARLVSITIWNAASGVVSILSGGFVFAAIIHSRLEMTSAVIYLIGLFALAVTYFTVNHLVNIIYLYFFIPDNLQTYIPQLPLLVIYEAAPVLFVPFVTVVYQELGWSYFLFFAFILITFALITHNLDRTRQRLLRRVQQLQSLQAVGQVLNSSLDLDVILLKLYEQVSQLMPADTFYIALYDRHAEEISFPVFIRAGNEMEWPTRKLRRGLTEYILQTKEPLLIGHDLPQKLQELGLEQIGISVTSWLGVPILTRNEVLGVISVQSISTPDVFDESDKEVLVTIASQSALAIQNASLYAETYQSLAQRVQELDSIFRTTQDGILLLNQDWQMVAVNRSFWQLLGCEQIEATTPSILHWPDDGPTLLQRLDYTVESLTADCELLNEQGAGNQIKARIMVSGDRHLARALTPVLQKNHQVNGWLLVLRDITEEVTLSQMREDMMHMMVHDLRGPLSILLGSLELGHQYLKEDDIEQFPQLLEIAYSNGERMLRLINDLLDIYKLETEYVPLALKAVSATALLEDVKRQFDPIIEESNLMVSIDVSASLPLLLVDYTYLNRVLYNLLDNAVKFTPDNGRILLWAHLDPADPLRAVLVGVTDSGAGILNAAKAQLFQKFRRGDANGRRQGTGLGLAFCKLAVEAHNGQIWVESTGVPGEGSTFIIRLPLPSSDLI